MASKKLKFPIETERKLDELFMDFGEWKPQLESGRGFNSWTFEEIIAQARKIMKGYIALLKTVTDYKIKKGFEMNLLEMQKVLGEAEKILKVQKGA